MEIFMRTSEDPFARLFPLRMEVSATEGHPFRNFDDRVGASFSEPGNSDKRLIGLTEELAQRTGLQGRVTNNELGGREWFDSRIPFPESQGFYSSSAEIGFGKSSRVGQIFTSRDQLQKTLAGALNDPTLWRKMTSEYNVASIRLGDTVYSFADDKVLQTKAEPGRPAKGPQQAFVVQHNAG
jgi:hypothetical protein